MSPSDPAVDLAQQELKRRKEAIGLFSSTRDKIQDGLAAALRADWALASDNFGWARSLLLSGSVSEESDRPNGLGHQMFQRDGECALSAKERRKRRLLLNIVRLNHATCQLNLASETRDGEAKRRRLDEAKEQLRCSQLLQTAEEAQAAGRRRDAADDRDVVWAGPRAAAHL